MGNVTDDQQMSPRHRPRLDQAAISVSLACLLHCLVVPIAIASLPSLSAALQLPSWTHAGLLGVALPLSFAGLLTGYRRHGRWLPAVIGLVGLGMMGLGLGFEDARLVETGLTVAGTTLVALAHLRNWRLSARAASAHARVFASSEDMV